MCHLVVAKGHGFISWEYRQFNDLGNHYMYSFNYKTQDDHLYIILFCSGLQTTWSSVSFRPFCFVSFHLLCHSVFLSVLRSIFCSVPCFSNDPNRAAMGLITDILWSGANHPKQSEERGAVMNSRDRPTVMQLESICASDA